GYHTALGRLDRPDPGVLPKRGAGRDRLLDEEGVESPTLRHPDQRRVVLAREARAVSKPELEAVDVALDHGRGVDGDPLQGPARETAAAGLVARKARLVDEQHADARASEVDRRRRPGRPGSDHERVVGLHGPS